MELEINYRKKNGKNKHVETNQHATKKLMGQLRKEEENKTLK